LDETDAMKNILPDAAVAAPLRRYRAARAATARTGRPHLCGVVSPYCDFRTN